MTSHETRLLRLVGAAAACAVAATGSIGCESSPPPPPVVTRVAPPPPPPKPTVTPIDQLMVQLGIDERVQLLEEDAPAKEDDRRAVLEFFDAFARGDDVIAALQKRKATGEHRRHSRRRADAVIGPLQRREPIFEGAHRGIGES